MDILTTAKKVLHPKIKMLITRVVQEVLYDPDFGLELSERAKKRLSKACVSKEKSVPFYEIKRKYL